MKATTPLRLALLANAIFSLCSGLSMALRPEVVDRWLGTASPLVVQILGLGLMLFAADLLHQATRPRIITWRALIASAADFAWVAGSVALLLGFPELFSALGKTLVFSVAIAVALFGAPVRSGQRYCS